MTALWDPIDPDRRDAVEDVLHGLVARAAVGELPLLGTREWLAADPDTQIAALAVVALVALAEQDPAVIGARIAAEAAVGRAAHFDAVKQASVAISQAMDWSAYSRNHLPHDALRRRRFPPNGDRGEWIEYGPRGGAA